MSSKVKQDGKKRRAEFEAARQKLNLTDRSFFASAANEANIRNESRPGWKRLERDQLENDFKTFVRADDMGRFEAPRYVHEKIDRTLGKPPPKPPRSAQKRRVQRQYAAAGGAHATA